MKLAKILFVLFAVLSVSVFAKDIKLTEESNQFVITNKSVSEFTFINHLSEINTVTVKKDVNEFVKLIVSGYGENAKKGNAELPVLEELINVPFGSTVTIKVLNTEQKIISLSDYGIESLIFPSQPSLLKSENAEDMPFYFNDEYYSYDGFYQTDLISTELLGKMRGQQLARISIAPFQYNPNTNQLKVITKMEVKVIFKNIDIAAHISNKQKYYSPEFEHLFKSCLNYIPMQEKDVITTYPVKYVIISDPAFQSALQPLVQWKTKKGFMVVEGYTNDPAVGNTTASIHAYLQDMYDNPIDGIVPTYLLIVGDDGQVPSFNNGNHLSDMYFCEFDGGGDFYPEMYYGRFSAINAGDVEAQVHKTLTHEQYTFSDPSFLDEVVLVAGVDASMAPTYGNGQINYGTDNYFNTAHGLTVYNYLYGSGTPITSDMSGASAAIIADVSAGVGFANYTAHCGSSGWSDPSFSTSDIAGLQNIDEFGFMVGNCCQSNKFDAPVCFGEGLLRAGNKGAVGYIGGSNNTYWNEDFWWAVGNGSIAANPTYAGTGLALFDCMMHENGEQQADWFITAGQLIHSGNLAVTQAGGSEQYYWEIYHLMGDPSLMPYIGVPTTLSVSHGAVTPVGATTFTVTTEENAYVAISMSGVLLDAQLADATGIVNLTFPAISNVGTADIVVTKQFKQPYSNTVQIISPTGPYVIYASNTIDDSAGNNNQLVDYNELISMNVDVQNVGSVNANSVNVTISTLDPVVTLINTTDLINVINPSQTLSINNPFTFQVDNNITDQHIVVFTLDMLDNLGNSWSSTINVTLNAPVLNHTTFTINDATLGNGNGLLDAGETLELIVDATNIGHADIVNLTAILGSLSSYVIVNTASANITSLNINNQQATVFNITVDANTPAGTYVEFPYDITDGTYTYANTFSAVVGVINEDYETGDFTNYAWVNDPVYPWVIDNVNVHEGVHSSKSGAGLPDNMVSHLNINIDKLFASMDYPIFDKLLNFHQASLYQRQKDYVNKDFNIHGNILKTFNSYYQYANTKFQGKDIALVQPLSDQWKNGYTSLLGIQEIFDILKIPDQYRNDIDGLKINRSQIDDLLENTDQCNRLFQLFKKYWKNEFTAFSKKPEPYIKMRNFLKEWYRINPNKHLYEAISIDERDEFVKKNELLGSLDVFKKSTWKPLKPKKRAEFDRKCREGTWSCTQLDAITPSKWTFTLLKNYLDTVFTASIGYQINPIAKKESFLQFANIFNDINEYC